MSGVPAPSLSHRIALLGPAVAAVLALALAPSALGVTLADGDIVANDSSTERVLRVDPATGAATPIVTIPSFLVHGIAVEPGGTILVSGRGAGGGPGDFAKVIRIVPETGATTVLTSGGQLVRPDDVDVEADGQIVVADSLSSGGRLVRVDPVSGAQSVIATASPTQAIGTFHSPKGVTVAGDGTLLVANGNTLDPGVIRFAASGGSPSTVASGEPPFEQPHGIALETDGDILVADPFVVPVSPGAQSGALIRIDATTHQAVPLMSGFAPLGVAVTNHGTIVITSPGNNQITEVDPATGATTELPTGLSSPYAIEVADIDRPPVADDDSYVANLDTPLAVGPPGVLANDVEPEGGPMTAIEVTGLAGLHLSGDGSFDYTPPVGFTGTVGFTYRASDGRSTSELATASIRVNAPSVAQADQYATDEDIDLVADAPGVLSNDADAEGDPLVVTFGQPVNGTVTPGAEPGSFTYAPAPDFFGQDTFDYCVADPFQDVCSPSSVTVTVRPVDDPPVARDDGFTTGQETTLTVPAPGVLANDSDPDGDPLVSSLRSAPANGSVTFSSDGSFAYSPNPGFSGADSFGYQAEDGSLEASVAIVTVTVTPTSPPTDAVSLAGTSVRERDRGTSRVTLTLTREGPRGSLPAGSVRWTATGITASEGADFTQPAAADRVVTFRADQKKVTLSGLTVVGDRLTEGNETVRVSLSSPTLPIAADDAIVTIVDDD